MLSELSIQNFAIIESAHLQFGAGLNILTGETGAGKSIVLGAIHLLLGGRAASDLIREGEETAHVEARFSPESAEGESPAWLGERLQRLGIEPDPDGELTIGRSISVGEKSTKNRIYINGQMATRATLLEVAQGLVDLCGQREHQILLDPQNHRLILDNLVGNPEALAQMRRHFSDLQTLFNRWQAVTSDQAGLLQKRDFLAFQIQEIEALNPQPDEDKQLQTELQRLSHAEELIQLASTSQQALDQQEMSVVSQMHAVLGNLRRAVRMDERFQNSIKLLEEALINCQEAQSELEGLATKLESDPQRLNQIESRLSALHNLQKKHGVSLRVIVENLEKMIAEFQGLSCGEEDLKKMRQEGQVSLSAALQDAALLTKLRDKTAKRLRQEIQKELAELAMAGCDFKVDLTGLQKTESQFPCAPAAAGLSEFGQEIVQFLLAPNLGEGFRPLHQIASGGELSRILLALKCILSPAEFTGTYLFDEIDSGIGGVTGSTVGRKLKNLSRKRQVICITHLPQIACFADHHLHVSKEKAGARTRTQIATLRKEERIEELARMLGGETPTKTSRAHAQELLKQCSSA